MDCAEEGVDQKKGMVLVGTYRLDIEFKIANLVNFYGYQGKGGVNIRYRLGIFLCPGSTCIIHS